MAIILCQQEYSVVGEEASQLQSDWGALKDQPPAQHVGEVCIMNVSVT